MAEYNPQQRHLITIKGYVVSPVTFAQVFHLRAVYRTDTRRPVQTIIRYLGVGREVFLRMHANFCMHIYILLNLILTLHKKYCFNYTLEGLGVKYIVMNIIKNAIEKSPFIVIPWFPLHLKYEKSQRPSSHNLCYHGKCSAIHNPIFLQTGTKNTSLCHL